MGNKNNYDVAIKVGIDMEDAVKMSEQTLADLQKTINDIRKTKKGKINYTELLFDMQESIKSANGMTDKIDDAVNKFVKKVAMINKLKDARHTGLSNLFDFFTTADLNKVLAGYDELIERQSELNKLSSPEYQKKMRDKYTSSIRPDTSKEMYNYQPKNVELYKNLLKTKDNMASKMTDDEINKYSELLDLFKHISNIKVDPNSEASLKKQQSLLGIMKQMATLESKHPELFKIRSAKVLTGQYKGMLNIQGDTDSIANKLSSDTDKYIKDFSKNLENELKKFEQVAQQKALKIYNNIQQFGPGAEGGEHVDIDDDIKKYIVDLDTAREKILELNKLTKNEPYMKHKEEYKDMIAFMQRFVDLGGDINQLGLNPTSIAIASMKTVGNDKDALEQMIKKVHEYKDVIDDAFGTGKGGTGDGTGTGTGDGSGIGISEEQLNRILVQINNIKDELVQIGTIISGLNTSNGLDGVEEIFQFISDSFNRIETTFSDNGSFNNAINSFSSGVEKINAALEKLDNSNEQIEQLKSKVNELSDAFNELKEKNEEPSDALYQNFQANNQAATHEDVLNTAKEMSDAIAQTGIAGNEARTSISSAQEEIQRKIKETTDAIKIQEEWLRHLNILFADYRTESKKEANDQLRSATNRLIDYRQNPNNYSHSAYAEEKINLSWWKSYQEAKRQGSGMLDKYDTDITEREITKIIDTLTKEYQYRESLLKDLKKDFDNLQQELKSLEDKHDESEQIGQVEESVIELQDKSNEASNKAIEVTNREVEAINEKSAALSSLAEKIEYLKKIQKSSKFMEDADERKMDMEEKAWDVGGNNPKSEQDSLNKINKYETLCENIKEANDALSEFDDTYEKVIITMKNGDKVEIFDSSDLDEISLAKNRIQDIQFVKFVSEEDIQNVYDLLRTIDDFDKAEIDHQLFPPVAYFADTEEKIIAVIDKVTEFRDKLLDIKNSDVFNELNQSRQNDVSNWIPWLNQLIETENKTLELARQINEQNRKDNNQQVFSFNDKSSPTQVFDNEIQKNLVMLENYKNTMAEINKLKLEPETDETKHKIEELNKLADYFASQITVIRSENGETINKSMMYFNGLPNLNLRNNYTSEQIKEFDKIAGERTGLNISQVSTAFSGIGQEIQNIEAKSEALRHSLNEALSESRDYVKKLSGRLLDLVDTTLELKTMTDAKDIQADTEYVNDLLKKYPELEKFKDKFTSYSAAKDFVKSDEWNDFLSTLPKAHTYLEELGYDFERLNQSSNEVPVLTEPDEPINQDSPAPLRVRPAIESPQEFADEVTKQLDGVFAEINVVPKSDSIASAPTTTGDLNKVFENIEVENQKLSELQDTIKNVTREVGFKTAAFVNEQGVVEKTVNAEKTKLESLGAVIRDNVIGAIDAKSQAFEDEKARVEQAVAAEHTALSGLVGDLDAIKEKSKIDIEINNKEKEAKKKEKSGSSKIPASPKFDKEFASEREDAILNALNSYIKDFDKEGVTASINKIYDTVVEQTEEGLEETRQYLVGAFIETADVIEEETGKIIKERQKFDISYKKKIDEEGNTYGEVSVKRSINESYDVEKLKLLQKQNDAYAEQQKRENELLKLEIAGKRNTKEYNAVYEQAQKYSDEVDSYNDRLRIIDETFDATKRLNDLEKDNIKIVETNTRLRAKLDDQLIKEQNKTADQMKKNAQEKYDKEKKDAEEQAALNIKYDTERKKQEYLLAQERRRGEKQTAELNKKYEYEQLNKGRVLDPSIAQNIAEKENEEIKKRQKQETEAQISFTKLQLKAEEENEKKKQQVVDEQVAMTKLQLKAEAENEKKNREIINQAWKEAEKENKYRDNQHLETIKQAEQQAYENIPSFREAHFL